MVGGDPVAVHEEVVGVQPGVGVVRGGALVLEQHRVLGDARRVAVPREPAPNMPSVLFGCLGVDL